MKKGKAVFAILFLALMTLINGSGLHVFAHDNHEKECVEHCSICELAFDLQSETFLATEITSYEMTLFAYPNAKQMNFTSPAVGIKHDGNLFSRPPPTPLRN